MASVPLEPRRSGRDFSGQSVRKSVLLNHWVAAKHDYRVALFQFRELFVFSLTDFEIVRRRISPTRRTKEANLAAFGVNRFSLATTSFHLDEFLFDGSTLLSMQPVRDDFVGSNLFRQTTETVRTVVLMRLGKPRRDRQFPRAAALPERQTTHQQENTNTQK